MRVLLSIALILSVIFGVQGQDNTIDERITIEEVSSDKSYGFKSKTNIKVGSVRE